jgi:hypothetical protein
MLSGTHAVLIPTLKRRVAELEYEVSALRRSVLHSQKRQVPFTAFGREAILIIDGDDISCPDAEWITEIARKTYMGYLGVELGPGKNKEHPGMSVGLNLEADPVADVFLDLNYGLKFLESNSVDSIYSNQVLEHLKKENQVYIWNEMYRVLKPGAKMEHWVPHYLSPSMCADPTHFTDYSEKSIDYDCIDDRTGEPFVEEFSDYGIECRFIKRLNQVRMRVDVHMVLEKPDEG